MERLKTRPQFQAALSGRTLAKTAHFALHCMPLVAELHAPLFSLYGVWLGAMVPKRWARRAVTRNAIKRQIYAVSAEYASQLGVAAHVVRLRSAIDTKQFVSASSVALKRHIRAELQHLFERACAVRPESAQGC